MKEIIQLPGHFTEVVKLATHPYDNKLLSSTDIEGKVCLWNPIYGYPLDIQTHEPNFNLPGISFSNNGEDIVTLSHDKSFKIWKIKNK
jgi:WD40 repeat protein